MSAGEGNGHRQIFQPGTGVRRRSSRNAFEVHTGFRCLRHRALCVFSAPKPDVCADVNAKAFHMLEYPPSIIITAPFTRLEAGEAR